MRGLVVGLPGREVAPGPAGGRVFSEIGKVNGYHQGRRAYPDGWRANPMRLCDLSQEEGGCRGSRRLKFTHELRSFFNSED